MKKIKLIFLNSLPILFMIGCIPVIIDDYLLSIIYIIISITSLGIYRERNDGIFYIIGFCFMFISECLFIATGVEVFERNTLLGIMPLWLPFLWAYGFIAIKRLVYILDK